MLAEIRHLGSWRQNAKTRFFQTRQFRAMVSTVICYWSMVTTY